MLWSVPIGIADLQLPWPNRFHVNLWDYILKYFRDFNCISVIFQKVCLGTAWHFWSKLVLYNIYTAAFKRDYKLVHRSQSGYEQTIILQQRCFEWCSIEINYKGFFKLLLIKLVILAKTDGKVNEDRLANTICATWC